MLKKILLIAMLVIGTNNIHADANNTVNVNSDEVILYARSAKKSYVVGEPIGIEIKLLKYAYMYFWSVDKEGKPQLMLPNDLESYNAYKKDVAYSVPEISADYSFISNHVGVEEVYVLASPKKLTKANVEKIMTKNIFVPKSQGNHKSITKTQKCGIIIAKKPNYDIVNFKIIVYGNPNEVKNNMVVKIEPNPYGLE